MRRLSETVDHNRHFGELLGDSPAMQAIYSQLAQLAETDTSVLVTGQSGTGKELVARSIHRRSRRAAGAAGGSQLCSAARNTPGE